MTEFERIARFLDQFRAAGGRTQSAFVTLGPGDDAAILKSAHPLAITTDAVVEGVHFRLDWCTARQLGHKALATNLSDLAAMGARPIAFTCALALPRSLDSVTLDEIAAGMGALAARHDVTLAGGNFTRASELSVTITAFGQCDLPVLRRDGAKVGDVVVLVGHVGEAALELALLEQGKTAAFEAGALHEPTPQIQAGRALARFATSAIDLSDGLAQDAGHVAEASGVLLEIDVAAVPHSARFDVLHALDRSLDSVKLKLSGGEDYALLLTVPPERVADAVQVPDARVIGRVKQGRGVRFVGLESPLTTTGHDHFRD